MALNSHQGRKPWPLLCTRGAKGCVPRKHSAKEAQPRVAWCLLRTQASTKFTLRKGIHWPLRAKEAHVRNKEGLCGCFLRNSQLGFASLASTWCENSTNSHARHLCKARVLRASQALAPHEFARKFRNASLCTCFATLACEASTGWNCVRI